METLNFEIDKTQSLDMQTLKRTYLENDVYGNPLRGVHHYALLQTILQKASEYNLQPDLVDMFAAENRSKQNPGVAKLPQIEDIKGKNAVEAYILRRLYTTIELKHRSDDELTTHIAIAYHQDGITIAMGTTVKICKNLCILGAEKIVSNFGKNKRSLDEIFQTVDSWFADFTNYQERDFEIINKMRQIVCSKADALQFIGMLTAVRVAHDSSIGDIKDKIDVYPLNQAQISQFTESYLRLEQIQEIITLWDLYNIATHLYKAPKMEIPNILPQNLSVFEVINSMYTL